MPSSDATTVDVRFTDVAAMSLPGPRRQRNEDAFLTGERMLAVADGMGGHDDGHLAAQSAIRALASGGFDDRATSLREAVEWANHEVLAAGAARSGTRMGTTLSVCRVEGGELGVAHVGDSRVFLLSDGTLTQVTHDHSFAQQLVDVGALTPEEARNHPGRKLITQALGRPTPEVAVDRRQISEGDIVVACSDGLTDVVSDSEIAAVLVSTANLEEAAEALAELATTSDEARDDVTVVVARIEAAAA